MRALEESGEIATFKETLKDGTTVNLWVRFLLKELVVELMVLLSLT